MQWDGSCWDRSFFLFWGLVGREQISSSLEKFLFPMNTESAPVGLGSVQQRTFSKQLLEFHPGQIGVQVQKDLLQLFCVELDFGHGVLS